MKQEMAMPARLSPEATLLRFRTAGVSIMMDAPGTYLCREA